MPRWAAARSGLLGDAGACAASGQLNQFLGTHASSVIYPGVAVLTPGTYSVAASTGPWAAPLTTEDVDQPFTLSGTTIGRVHIPIMPVGQGADLLVSLCADNAGTPGTMITQTRIPATWISQLSPVAGTAIGAATAPAPYLTGNPLAVAPFRMAATSLQSRYSYPMPAATGISASSSTAWYDPYVMQIGGVNGGAALSSVFTIPYASDGVFGTPIPQTSFPEPNDGSSATIVATDAQNGAPVVVNCGGGTSYGGPTITNVYTATLDAATGALSAWSAQAALPYAVQNHTMATYNGYVYVIGGQLNGSTTYANVTYAQVVNGQIAAWTATTPLPAPRTLTLTAVSQGFLVVSVGTLAGDATSYETTWYAQINADGSLGAWLTGPSVPSSDIDLNANAFGNDQGIYAGGINNFSFLAVGPDGPSNQWIFAPATTFGQYPGYHDAADGTVSVGALYNGTIAVFNIYEYGYLSVPLPASGLTNAATYHVLMQQLGGDLGDYLILPVNLSLPKSGLTSPRAGYTWTAIPDAGSTVQGIALSVFDNTPPAQGAMPWHTWEDSGARITTAVWATTPDRRLLGLCEATTVSTQLNANAGFETGTAPWSATGASLTQSTTEVYTGQYAAQITPDGTAAQATITSELLGCLPGQQITVSGWFWFTDAVTTTFSLSIAWYASVSAGGGYLASAGPTSSAPAATWTPVTNTLTAPPGAYQYAIVPTVSGTPPASQIWYADAVMASDLTGPQHSTVTQVTYPGTDATGGAWPPTGLTVLA